MRVKTPEFDDPPEVISVRCRSIVKAFCVSRHLNEDLYSPDRMASRLPPNAINNVLPNGWMFVTDEWTEDLVRKRPLYNRKKLRQLCVELKVPYWHAMTVNEMKAVIVHWAIEHGVSETKI